MCSEKRVSKGKRFSVFATRYSLLGTLYCERFSRLILAEHRERRSYRGLLFAQVNFDDFGIILHLLHGAFGQHAALV